MNNILLTPFYKNIELAEILKVSQVSITRYIKSAINKENNLELVKSSGRFYIAKTDANISILNGMVSDVKNFKNKPKYKQVTVSPNFYETYSYSDRLEIVRDLKNKHYVNPKFSYHGEGAKYFNIYRQKAALLAVKNAYCIENQLNFFINHANSSEIVYNVIELGPAELKPSINFLKQLHANNILNSYTGIEISQEMIDFSKKAFSENLPEKLFNGVVLDFENNSLLTLLADIKYAKPNIDGRKMVNMILAVGNTLTNVTDISAFIENISASIGYEDFLCYDGLYHYTDFYTSRVYNHGSPDLKFLTHTIDTIGIPGDAILVYNAIEKETMVNKIYAEFLYNVEILFKFDEDVVPIKINKGDRVTIMSNRLSAVFNDLEVAKKVKLNVVNITSSYDMKFINFLFKKNDPDKLSITEGLIS